jgi:DinB superfamily
MRTLTTCALAGLLAAVGVHAQMPAASKNPVSDTIRQMLARDQKNLVGSAQLMPAEKYSYHPTPAQMTFGHLVMHVAQSNASLCKAVSSATAPDFSKLKETDPKATLVQAITQSFEYCTKALADVNDTQLGDEATMFGRKSTKAAVMISIATDLADHYSQAAGYLRLNGILPPTAQRGRMGGR